MFDRFKKSADGAPKSDAAGTPPAAGGFGRRQTPVTGSPPPNIPADIPPPIAGQSGGFGRRATPLVGVKPDATRKGQLNPNPDLAKASKGGSAILNFLMQAYRDPRGVHIETIVGAAAVLAGEFALRASAPFLPKEGWIAGGPADALMYRGFPGENNRPTLWSIMRVVVLDKIADASQLPNMDAIAMRASDNIGRSFPPPLSIPTEHFPREFSPNACPRFRAKIMEIAAEQGLDPTETALALGFSLALLIKNTHQLVPVKVLTTLAAELMVAVTRMAPRNDEV